MTTPATPDVESSRPAGMTYLFTLAALVITLAGVYQMRTLLGPAFLGLTLLLSVRPLHRMLVRRRVPSTLSAIIMLLLTYVLLLGLLSLIAFALSELAQKLPEYGDKFNQLYDQGLSFLSRFGISEDTLKNAFDRVDWQNLAGYATTAVKGLGGASSQLLTMLIVMFFLAIDTAQFRGRFATLDVWRPQLSEALHRFSYQVRQYWIVSTVFGFIVAVLDVIFLSLYGVPLAITWGVLAFVTNYIPNVGFIIGLVPPVLIALLDGGLTKAIVVAIVFTAINFVMQTLVQPKFTGDAVGLNTTVTFVSLLFWAAVIGPIGAILAVPLTLFAKAILIDSDERTRWLNLFLRNTDDEDEAAAPTAEEAEQKIEKERPDEDPDGTPEKAGVDTR